MIQVAAFWIGTVLVASGFKQLMRGRKNYDK